MSYCTVLTSGGPWRAPVRTLSTIIQCQHARKNKPARTMCLKDIWRLIITLAKYEPIFYILSPKDSKINVLCTRIKTLTSPGTRFYPSSRLRNNSTEHDRNREAYRTNYCQVPVLMILNCQLRKTHVFCKNTENTFLKNPVCAQAPLRYQAVNSCSLHTRYLVLVSSLSDKKPSCR